MPLPMIYGERIRHGRQMRGLTQSELAVKLGVSQPTIARIESGRDQPSEDLLSAIALQTGFPPPFFRRPPADHLPEGSLLFRARASTTAREKAEAHAYADTIFELVQVMAAQLEVDKPRIPRLEAPPAEAARITRAALGESPDRPILHLVHALEKAGAYVFAIPAVLDKRDAFSTWTRGEPRLPIIALASDRPGDRLRFSVAHELGHLVLHAQMTGSVPKFEQEADEFAAELLLPAASMSQEIAPPFNLAAFAALKLRWRVSIQSLVRRARDLDLITDRQYRYLFEQIAARGWRTQEPEQLKIPVEKPRAVRKMAEMLYGNPIDYRRLAGEAHLTPRLVKDIIEAHADRHELTVVLADDRHHHRRQLQLLHTEGRSARRTDNLQPQEEAE